MGFFDFFRTKKEKTETEKISLENLESWLEKKQKENAEAQNNFLKEICKKIHNLADEIELACDFLEKARFSDKRAPYTAKLLVKENAKHYSLKARKLSNDLKNLKEEQVQIYLEKLDNILSDFKKRSATNYQKASILIGNELAKIPNLINETLEEINYLKKEKEKEIEFSKTLSLIKQKLNEKENLLSNQKTIEKYLEELSLKLEALKKENEETLKEIETIRSSKKYQEFLRRKEEYARKKEDLKNEIYALKESIDFKSLAKIYYGNENKTNLLKSYRENFYDSFEKDLGKTLIEIFLEGNSKQLEIKQKIEAIIEKRKNIEEIKPEENPLFALEAKRKKIMEDIELAQESHIQEAKKIEKLEEKLTLIEKDIISALEKEEILISK